MHSLLAVRLLVPTVDLFSNAGRAWLEQVELDELGRKLCDSDLSLLAAIEEQIELIDAELCRAAWADERAKLLMTLPGVDVVVAMTLLAAFGDASRFRDAIRLAA